MERNGQDAETGLAARHGRVDLEGLVSLWALPE